MAWDYALAHPDLFAGVVVISGLPAKYVPRYLSHHLHLPLFIVLGDLAPAANEFIYDKYVKPLIGKAWDVTYVEYYRRGLEEIPEEIGPAFDWMDRHRREPYPKTFKAVTARTSDDRFFGVVVREFKPGHTTAPEAAEILGKNLNPASIEMKTSSLAQPDQARGRRHQPARCLALAQDCRLQAETGVSHREQGQAVLQGYGQARDRIDPRRPARPRRPPAALLAPDQRPVTKMALRLAPPPVPPLRKGGKLLPMPRNNRF